MGISSLQSGLGGVAQEFGQSQIAGLGALGSAQQAQNQAVLDAQRQASTMAVQEPINRLNMLGEGVVGLMGGSKGMGTTIGEVPDVPQASALEKALGLGLTAADIYGRVKGYGNNQSSDIQLKEDIKLTGKSPLGLNVYSFKYKGEDGIYQGVMAQEVPWASSIAENGYLQVDYSKVDVEFKRIN